DGVVGLISITNDAEKQFILFSKSARSDYFAQLLNEIADKVPVRRTRLSTDEKFQYINHRERIIFSIQIDLPNPELNESVAESVASDLNAMILNKAITTISTGFTNDLDNRYGFVPL
ncbi:619_t:CDS:1, partial [Ambispora leptoticha]